MTAATITVQLLSSSGEPAWGKTVRLSSNRGALDTIAQPSTVTGSDGRTTGTIHSTTPGTATISALVLDDGVLLANPASVTFEPYTPPSGAFLSRLNQLVDTAVDGLNQIKDDAQAIANDGDYFRGAIVDGEAKRAIGLFFNIADVIGGLGQIEQLKLAARLACPGCYIPGTWNVRFSYDHPAAARLLDIGFMRLDEVPASQIAEFIGWGSPQFYGKVLHAGARHVSKEVAKDAIRSIFVFRDDGMTAFVYPAIGDTADDLAALLEVQRDNVLANLPAMTPDYQSAYETDLAKRNKALNMLKAQVSDERMMLANLRASREGLNKVLFALRLGVSLPVAYTDGPGLVLKGFIMVPFDWYMDSHQLSEDEYAYDLAVGALLGAPNALLQTYGNASSALRRIADLQLPDPAIGRISSVTHYTQGERIWGG